jgi:hypothetical protein
MNKSLFTNNRDVSGKSGNGGKKNKQGRSSRSKGKWVKKQGNGQASEKGKRDRGDGQSRGRRYADVVGRSAFEMEEKAIGEAMAEIEVVTEQQKDEQLILIESYSVTNMNFARRKELFDGQYEGAVVVVMQPQKHDLILTRIGGTRQIHVLDRYHGVHGKFFPLCTDDKVITFDKLRRFALVEIRADNRENLADYTTQVNISALKNDAVAVLENNIHLIYTEKSLNVQYAINLCCMDLRVRYSDDIIIKQVVTELIHSESLVQSLDKHWTGVLSKVEDFSDIHEKILLVKNGGPHWYHQGWGGYVLKALMVGSAGLISKPLIAPVLVGIWWFHKREQVGIPYKPANFIETLYNYIPRITAVEETRDEVNKPEQSVSFADIFNSYMPKGAVTKKQPMAYPKRREPSLAFSAGLWWLQSKKVGKTYKPANFAETLYINVPKICTKLYRSLDFPLQEGTKLTSLKECRCEEKQEYTPIVGATIEGAKLVCPTQCCSNVKAACGIRALFPRTWDEDENNRFSRFFRSFWLKKFGKRGLVFDEMPFEDWLEDSTYTLSQKDELREGREAMLTKIDFEAGMFVKDEGYVNKTPVDMKPRKIETRTPHVLSRLGPYFKSASKSVKKSLSYDSPYYYGAGSDENINAWFAHFHGGFIYEIDYSNWDGSMTPWDLKNEVWFIEHIMSTLPSDWDLFKKYWLRKKAKGKGVIYTSNFGRSSGDAYTSFFNTIFNLALSAYLIKSHYSIVGCGDDGVVFSYVEEPTESIIACAARLGRKIDILIKPLHDVEFCSGKFWMVDGEWVFGMKPFRQLAKLGLNHKGFGPLKIPRYLLGIALSQQGIANHVPLYGPLLLRIIELFHDRKALWLDDYRYKMSSSVIHEIGDDTRVQFEMIYGISVSEQLEIEASYESLTIDSFPLLFTGDAFKRGYRIDVGALHDNFDEVMDYELKPAKLENVEKSTFPWFSMFCTIGAACLEEAVRYLCPVPTTIVLSVTEGVLADPTNFFLHIAFYSAGWWAVPLHITWNVHAILRREKQCNFTQLLMKTMTNNKNKKKTKGKSGKKNKNNSNKNGDKAAWRVALGNLMRAGGASAGTYFGGPVGGQIGGALGNGIAHITGMGDYKIEANSLISSNVTFGNGSFTMAHREYIGDIYSYADYTTVVYDINPGLSTTFPWLAVLAENYERYDMLGLVFEFVSTAGYLTSTQAQGVLVMSTQYDPDASNFVNRREMEAYMYTTSGIVTENQTHFVECDPRDRPLKEMYIRTGATSANERWTDLGRFTVAVEGCPADDVLIGELWVTYHVKFELPRLEPHGYGTASWAHISNGAYTNNDILGTIQTTPVGTLAITVSASGSYYNTVNFPAILDRGIYLISYSCRGSSTASLALSYSYTNCSLVADTFALGNSSVQSVSGATDDTFMANLFVIITGKTASVTFTTATLPTSGASMDLYVAQVGDPSPATIATYSEALLERGLLVSHPKQETKINRFIYGMDHDDCKSEDLDYVCQDDSYDSYLKWRSS